MLLTTVARPMPLVTCFFLILSASSVGQSAENLLANPGFELGSHSWHLDKGGKTDAQFTVDNSDAYDGQHSALVTIGSVEEWGAQFGQTLDAGSVGKTYTFAALAKSTGQPVVAALQIERRAKPWDRVAKSRQFTLTADEWTELHVTFTVKEPFPQGWFAYLTSTQPNAQLRVDAFRLVEGEYVPYDEAARNQMAAIQVSLFDTGTESFTPSRGGSFGNPGWAKLPEDETDHSFRGDAVMTNDRLVVVLRRGGLGAEVYSKQTNVPAPRAVLEPVCGDSGLRLAEVSIVENTPAFAALDATFKDPGGETCAVRYELEMGQVFVKTEARSGTTALRLRAPCRFLVLPDFFADDIMVDAAEIPVPRAELPAEHFLLHALGDGQAMVMSVADSAEQDVAVTLSGQSAERRIDHSEIRYAREGKIWVAALEADGLWHARHVAKDDAGKVLPLDWRAPYPAQWRVDWRRDDQLTGSWEMITERPDGTFDKHGWFGQPQRIAEDRQRWTTVLGRFHYPCWVDEQGRGFLQPFAKRVRFQGPALIYPINRTHQTPLDRLTVVDVVRATLGVGPCEYVLDVEGQGAAMKGRATCATRDTLNPIYAAGRQRRERATIERALDDVLIFVRHIRSRIDAYVAFGHELLDHLDDQRKAHPELAEFITEMETLTRAIDERFEARKEKIRTPQYVADLTDKFRRTLLDYEGPDAAAQCKEITGAIVEVGGNQDELVGECRVAVKVLRQRAGLAMALDPRVAEIATEIRRRTQQVLRNASSYEAPRH